MSWPVCFDAKTIRRLEKSWSPYEGMLPQIQALTSELYEACLIERLLRPESVRASADFVLQHQLGLYPLGEWSKIIYRMNATLQNLVSSVEISLTIEEVDLIEARFELGYFENIEGYAKQMALKGASDQVLALAIRMHNAGSDGAIPLITSAAMACAGQHDSGPIKQLLRIATDELMSWTGNAELNFWMNPNQHLSPLVHLERLLLGEYPWTKMSLRFVEQRLSTDTLGQDGRRVDQLISDLSDDHKVNLITAAYGARPPVHLESKYKAIVGMLVPDKILGKKTANLMIDVIAGRSPEWLNTVLKNQGSGLARLYPSIQTVTYQILHSTAEQIKGIDLPERFAQGMASLLYTLDDPFRESFDSTRFVDWGNGRQVVICNSDIGETLVGFFRETMPHIVFDKKLKNQAASSEEFLKFLEKSDVHEFLLMAGAILKGLGRHTDMVGVLVQSFPNAPLIVKDFAGVLGIPKETMMASHWYRDFHLAGDLGL